MAFIDQIKKAHIIGAGGIGISAVAKLLVKNGVEVTGSDIGGSEVIEDLRKAGVEISVGHSAEHLPTDADIVVRSGAVPDGNPELARARDLGIRDMTYFEFLGEYSKDKRTIAVSGTNGKSSTTAMLGMMLTEAGLDPTVIVGSKVPSFPDGNLRVGKSDLFVVEACEHEANMLNFHPDAAIVTNVEEDHLDFYKTRDNIIKAFNDFLGQIDSEGFVVMNADDSACMEELKTDRSKVTFSVDSDADYKVTGITCKNGYQEFVISCRDERSCRFSLKVPGRFNVYNAAAAIAMAAELGAEPDSIHAALDKYTGIWRRFEILGEHDGALIISDYGHHPTAVAATVQAAKEFYPGREIILLFQPHHHNRTKELFSKFVESFDGAGAVILAEIFDVAGREDEDDAGVSSQALRDAIAERDAERGVERHLAYAKDIDSAYEQAVDLMQSGDIVIVMGAGDIYKIAHKIVGRQ
jgi:UDP-N-acetylmuramate--alanine ligase